MKKDRKLKKKESKVKKSRSERLKADRNNWQQVRGATCIVRREKQIVAVTLLRLCPLVVYFILKKYEQHFVFWMLPCYWKRTFVGKSPAFAHLSFCYDSSPVNMTVSMQHWWKDTDSGRSQCAHKGLPTADLSNTNPVLRSERSATDRLNP